MRVVADSQIPCLPELLGGWAEVVQVPGSAIDSERVREADILLVRSVTRVDRYLLEGSRVRFVGSATSGIDHVNTAYLREKGIAFAHAPGANARSVVEYVLTALYLLAAREGVPLSEKTVGIVGYGQIGRRLAQRLEVLGCRLLLCDPPLARQAEAGGKSHPFIPLEELLERADVVTFHVPLTYEGLDATYHLLHARRLELLRPGSWLINTSRGAVVDNRALRERLERQRDMRVVLDVWEGEPELDTELLKRVVIGTPHIAGYSMDGKFAGIRMVYEALCQFLGREARWPEVCMLSQREILQGPTQPLSCDHPAELYTLLRRAYDIEQDDRALREILQVPLGQRGAFFRRLRQAYPLRLEFSHYCVEKQAISLACLSVITRGLGLCLLA